MTKKTKQPRHYTPRASEPRHKTGVTLLQQAWAYAQTRAKEWGLTNNAALDRIVIEHQSMNIEPDVYDNVIKGETKKRQKAKLLAEMDRLVREIKEMEDGDDQPSRRTL